MESTLTNGHFLSNSSIFLPSKVYAIQYIVWQTLDMMFANTVSMMVAILTHFGHNLGVTLLTMVKSLYLLELVLVVIF